MGWTANSTILLIDSHTHFYDEWLLPDADAAVARALAAGVGKMVQADVDSRERDALWAVNDSYPGVLYPMVGLYPCSVGPDWKEEIDKMLPYRDRGVVAVGEIGLDYHEGDEDRDLQKEALRVQLELASQWDLPVNIHLRDAWGDLFTVLEDCRHLHLPFQSGSDRILQKMNRHYNVERYLEIVDYAKSRIPDIDLTSDVIVGFPGETEEDFEQTLALMQQVEFTSLFTFIYSPRVGTPAAKMEDPYTHEQKAQRMTRLLQLQEQISAKRTAAMIGRSMRVLVEEQAVEGLLNARTQGGVVVEVAGDASLIGTFQTAEITEARNFILRGQLLYQ